MSGIKNVPTLGFCRADGNSYVLRDGRECASPRELIMGLRLTAEHAREEQRRAAMFGSNTPSMIKMRGLRETLFEIALDKAFLLGCRGLSIGDKDLIADDSRMITSTTRKSMFSRYSAWELADFLGVGAGCGNGKGNGIYQYQYHSFYFADSHQGVWDTATGERLRDPFELFGCATELHDFYATLYKPSEISKTALECRTKPEAKTCEAVPC